ncbi:MAG: oligosaccharide flippase family protein [Idiomarina sp.]|nr:oligosaccharide flippase family protein [Idiomarina sp.]
MYLVASIINSSIPFLLLPILTRYLTPTEYGEVAMFLVWTSLIAALCGLSVHGAANRKYFDYKDEPKKLAEYIFMCFVILVVSSSLMLLVVLLLAPYLSLTLGISTYWLILGVPVAALGFIKTLRLGQWQVTKQPGKYGIFQISQSLVNLGLSLLFVVTLYMGATGRILGLVISAILFAIIALILLVRDGLIKVTWQPSMARDALHFGVPLIPHIIGIFLLNTVDRAVITATLGLDQAGIYMVAIQLSLAAAIILDAVNKTFVPWLFERLKRDSHQEKIVIVKVTYAYYGLLAVGVLFGFLWADNVLLLIVGPDYAPAAALIGWVILAKGFHGGYLMVTNYLFYAKRTGVLSTVTIVSGLLNVCLLFVFINYAGLIGVAWAYCISKFIQWILTWVVANRVVRMPWLTFLTTQK